MGLTDGHLAWGDDIPSESEKTFYRQIDNLKKENARLLKDCKGDIFMYEGNDEIRLITAVEAREVSNAFKISEINNEIKFINEEIKNACDKGKDSVCIDGSVSVDTKELLIKNGFKVTTGSQYNELYTDIKWGV